MNYTEHLLVDFRLLNSLNIPLSVETVCVFTAPIFSANAAWATFLLTKVVFLGKFKSIWHSGTVAFMHILHSHSFTMVLSAGS